VTAQDGQVLLISCIRYFMPKTSPPIDFTFCHMNYRPTGDIDRKPLQQVHECGTNRRRINGIEDLRKIWVDNVRKDLQEKSSELTTIGEAETFGGDL